MFGRCSVDIASAESISGVHLGNQAGRGSSQESRTLETSDDLGGGGGGGGGGQYISCGDFEAG